MPASELVLAPSSYLPKMARTRSSLSSQTLWYSGYLPGLSLPLGRAAALSRYPFLEKLFVTLFPADDPGVRIVSDTLLRFAREAAPLRGFQRSAMMNAMIQLIGMAEPFSPNPQTPDWRVRRAIDYIELNLSVPGLTAESVAMDQRISRRRLDQLMHEAFGLRATLVFDLAPGEYHTNVVLAVLAGRAAVVCPRGFADPAVPAAIADFFHPHAVDCDEGEHAAFVGNCIALSAGAVWMSANAGAALSPAHRALLAAAGFQVRTVPLEAIEAAGGSLRCCIGEIF